MFCYSLSVSQKFLILKNLTKIHQFLCLESYNGGKQTNSFFFQIKIVWVICSIFIKGFVFISKLHESMIIWSCLTVPYSNPSPHSTTLVPLHIVYRKIFLMPVQKPSLESIHFLYWRRYRCASCRQYIPSHSWHHYIRFLDKYHPLSEFTFLGTRIYALNLGASAYDALVI